MESDNVGFVLYNVDSDTVITDYRPTKAASHESRIIISLHSTTNKEVNVYNHTNDWICRLALLTYIDHFVHREDYLP